MCVCVCVCVCVCECVCMCVYVGVWVGVSPTVVGDAILLRSCRTGQWVSESSAVGSQLGPRARLPMSVESAVGVCWISGWCRLGQRLELVAVCGYPLGDDSG